MPNVAAAKARLEAQLAELEGRQERIKENLDEPLSRDSDDRAIELEDDLSLAGQALLISREIASVQRALKSPVKRLKSEIAAADGVLFVTPEYNRSIPGVLKNAIDHASRPYGQNAWAGKPAGVIGISVGAIGTALAQQHLRSVLAYLDMPTLGQPEAFLQMKDDLFESDGGIGPASRAFLQGWMNKYVDWVKKHAS
jgi:NAD(P)H-dependent FMN reductase